MICADTDTYVNVQSSVKKETKNPGLLKLPIYSTELAAVIFFEKYYVKYTKGLAVIPFFYGECVNLTIS